MEHFDPEHLDPELDALLRDRRPHADGRWVAATERELFPQQKSWFAWRPAPALRMGAALAVVLAALLLAMSLFGSSPLSDSEPVKADDNCRTVKVTRVERVPIATVDADGEPKIEYRRQSVERFVERCD